MAEVTNTKNSEGLSGVDKLLMNQNKLDEGSVTLTDLNIELTLKKLHKMHDIEITDDEIDYYIANHKPNKLQQQLVYAYYAKYFGNYRDLNLLTRRQYITLLLLLKKKLLIDLGFEHQKKGEIASACLPYILTGNISDKVNTRIIRNNKFIAKLQDNYMYQELLEKKYNLLEEIKEDFILSLLSSIINTRFTYVVYGYDELLDEEIRYSDDKIADELLFFLKCI